ncbi:MAG TPA: SIMPL domain-containing protein [Bdellovibrio sp.]|nr:SIMPL domain-containing protein [Bdellovibrio sp.]
MTRLLVLAFILNFATTAFANEHLIVVNGNAEKSLDPNMVSMNIDVWSKAPTAKQAQQLAANQYKSVKKTFDEFKIKKEDVQTDNYTLSPEYVYNQKLQQNKMTGFRVSQTLVVTLHKVDDVGNFLDALVEEKTAMDSGVNVNNINWDSDQRTKMEMSLLADAVRSARAKADEIAKAANVKIKNVARISQGSRSVRPPMPMMRGFDMASKAGGAATELEAGQIKIRVEVEAEYEL